MMNMEEQLDGAATSDSWRDEFVRALEEHRQRAAQMLGEHRKRAISVEATLKQQIQALADEFAGEWQQMEQRGEELGEREAALAQHSEQLAQTQEDLARRQTDWEHRQADFSQQHKALQEDLQHQSGALERQQVELESAHNSHEEREQANKRREAELAELCEQFDANQRQLESRQVELDRAKAAVEEEASRQQQKAVDLKQQHYDLGLQRSELQRQNDQLDQRVSQTNSQRRHISRELRAQRTEMLAEVERCRAELQQVQACEQAELEQQLLKSQSQCESFQKQLEECNAQLEQSRQLIDQLSAQLQEAAVNASAEVDAAAAKEVDSLREERDRLIELLEGAKTEIERIEASSGGYSEQLDDLQKRHEMAMDDVRQLKSENAQLKDGLAKAPQAAPTANVATGGGLDWEAQKKKLLEELESDFDEQDERQVKDKLTVEGTIRITDQVVAEKEDEIRELKRLLDEQSGNIGELAIGAAAFAKTLDQNELIREERDNLKQLQDEWRDKLRKAEIDISVERAKLARERADMEEKLQQLESSAATQVSADGDDGNAKKPARGRWLTRLGLKETEEE